MELHQTDKLSFLNNGSDISQLIKKFDWSQTNLGIPEKWNENLKSKLNTVMYSSFPMILFWGDDLICFYNEPFRKILGSNGKHSSIGLPAKSLLSESWNVFEPLFKDVLKTFVPIWKEDEPIKLFRNGKVQDCSLTFSLSPLTDENSNVAGAVIVCLETTEKVNLFKQLNETNNLYSFAIDSSELGTWDLNPNTGKFVANERLKEWFGMDGEDELQLYDSLNSIMIQDRERVQLAINQALQNPNYKYDIEYTILHPKTGLERTVKARGKASFDENNKAVRFNGILIDITAEVETNSENKKLSVLVENSVDLMAILKMDGKNSYINKAGKFFLGIEENADVNKIPIADFHTAEQLAFVEKEILPSVMEKGRWAGEFAIRNGKTGEIIPLYNNCHRIDDARTGLPIAIGTVMRDIRPEINARHKLEQEVKERTKELLLLNEELERKNKELASLAFVSSHDLQEPLRKINTFISRIEEDTNLPEKALSYFTRIKASTNRMQILINDLLAFSNTNQPQKHMERTSLNNLLHDLLVELEDKISEAGAEIRISEMPVMKCIPYQVTQLFSNLILNSLKFADKSRSLVIDIHADSQLKGSDLIINYLDNGIGFAPLFHYRIFEAFQRLHSKDEYEGSGIGLAICKKIMENHNGSIKANGIPGKGATFSIYFANNK